MKSGTLARAAVVHAIRVVNHAASVASAASVGALVAVALLAAPAGLHAQATLYPAGDPAAVTTIVKGNEVCGTLTSSMNSEDGTMYSTMSASEFAALVPSVRGSVPNPMGRDTSAATAGRWGVTVVNPGRSPLNVTQVQIDSNASGLFNGIAAVSPATGWASTQSVVTWTGSIDVPPHSALDFIVQIAPRNQTGAAIVTLRATTAAGVLTGSAFATAERASGAVPYVSLPFVVNGLDVFSGNATNTGTVETGQVQVFQVRVKESEAGNTQPIPTGSILTITIPPGWTGVTAASGQTGFSSPAVSAPGVCTPGSIVVATSATILNSSNVFQFSAAAPAYAAGVGLYPFEARLTGTTPTDAIDTRTEFTQEVGIPLTGGVRAGLTALELDLSVPNPMGSKKVSTWGAAVANPLDTPYTVTQLDINMTGGNNFFNSITAIRPATGWVRVSAQHVRWTGSVRIDPHDAENFIVQIQCNNSAGTDRPVRVTVNGTLTKDASTSQGNGNGTVCANLYYLSAGQPSVYTYGVPAGQAKNFTVAIKESGDVNINAGAMLRVVIPAGWSAVSAPPGQTGFSAPTVVQPTPTSPGEIRTTTTVAFQSSQLTLQFTATAPPNLQDSLFVFPTTLTSSQVRSICDMVVLVSDDSGGLDLEHVSAPVAETNLNQVDVQVVAGAAPDTPATISIYNYAAATWEPLVTRTLGAAPATSLSSLTANLDRYFDLPVSDGNKRLRMRLKANGIDNYRVDEDYVVFIVSQYRVDPTNLAPANTFRGAIDVPMLGLEFSTDTGSVDLYTLKVTGGGTDLASDVTMVHLVGDANCNGAIDAGDNDLAAAAFAPDGTVTFGAAPAALLTFDSTTPSCALVTYDISATAGAFDLVSAHVADGFDLTSSVGPLYPFPAVGGFPIDSGDALIPGGPPSLALDKSFAPPLVPPALAYPVGTAITYTIDVTNIGESASTNVVVSDPLDPAWAPYTGVVTPLDGGVLCLPPACNPARIDWPSIPTLAGNSAQTSTVRFQVQIPNTVPDGTNVLNTAAAVSVEEPSGTASNLSDLPVCAPVVTLEKTLPALPADYAAGEVVRWTLTLRNNGSCAANSLVLTDVVDVARLGEASLVFNPPASYDAASDTATWSLASLAPGATAVFTAEGTVLVAAEGSPVCNSAAATWDEAVATLGSDPLGGTCTAPIVGPRCTQTLVVDKTLPASPTSYAEGEPIEWTITVRNTGLCAATGVVLRDALDTTLLEAPFTFTPPTGVFDGTTGTYTWPAVAVQGAGVEVLTYRIGGVIKSGTQGSTICNTAIASFNEGADVTSSPTTGTCSTVPIEPPRCVAAAITAASGLTAVKVGGTDIRFAWTGPGSPEQHLNSVDAKADIPSSKRGPTGTGAAVCTGAATGCTVAGAVTSGAPQVFYQAYGACGSLGSDEGAI